MKTKITDRIAHSRRNSSNASVQLCSPSGKHRRAYLGFHYQSERRQDGYIHEPGPEHSGVFHDQVGWILEYYGVQRNQAIYVQPNFPK